MYTGTLKATELGMGGPAGQSIALPVGSDSQARRGYAISGTFQGDSDSGSWLSVLDPTETPGPGQVQWAPSGACQVLCLPQWAYLLRPWGRIFGRSAC